MQLIRFCVIDNQTGKYPDCEKIALSEEWAKHLIYCDIDSFAITEEGGLILIDDCNNIAYPPSDRFTVTIDPSTLRPKGEWIHRAVDAWECIHCKDESDYTYDFCPHCGADMRKGKDDETDHG